MRRSSDEEDDDVPPLESLDVPGDEKKVIAPERVLGQSALRNAANVVGRVRYAPAPAVRAPAQGGVPSTTAFTDYAGMYKILRAVATEFPRLVELMSVGQSYEGREIWAARICDDVSQSHPQRPAVLFTAGQHGREHLSVEMSLFILRALTTNFNRDADITAFLRHQVIFIIFNVNPDGSEYDFRDPGTWRKNRQPVQVTGSKEVGTDLNRNWGWCWGVTRSKPHQDDYDGEYAFSAPETQAVRDFVLQHVTAGSEQIKASIDFHSFAQYILFPFGYTADKYPPDGSMTPQNRSDFLTLAHLMAKAVPASGTEQRYGVKQSANLGTGAKTGVIIDWLWGAFGILAFTMELYPPRGTGLSDRDCFVPDGKVIYLQVSRAFSAVKELLRQVDARFAAPPPAPPAPPPQPPPPAPPPPGGGGG